MASVISSIILVAATLLAVASAFPSEKLRYNRPPPFKALPSPNQQPAGPKGLVPRPERSTGEDLKTAESYGYGYGYGYPYGGYGYGGFGYPYGGYGYGGFGYGYGGYGYGGFGWPYYGGFYGGFGYPGLYDWWWF